MDFLSYKQIHFIYSWIVLGKHKKVVNSFNHTLITFIQHGVADKIHIRNGFGVAKPKVINTKYFRNISSCICCHGPLQRFPLF